ncbi:MAG: Mor transcription activator family protein [Desulfobulbaceae bacterium]
MADMDNIIELPDDALPDISELKGDLRLLAEVLAEATGDKIAGVRLALVVAQKLGGTPLRIVTGKKWVLRWRDKCMRRDYDRGNITVVALARKYHLTDRQVYNILGQADPDTRQMGLW